MLLPESAAASTMPQRSEIGTANHGSKGTSAGSSLRSENLKKPEGEKENKNFRKQEASETPL